jgi:rhamnogalacturonan endolyase
MVHEEKGDAYPYDTEFRDAKTGEVIWGLPQSGNDVGRGLAADIDSTHRGVECWPIRDYAASETPVFTCTGEKFSTNRPTVNFGIYYKNYRYQQCFDGSEGSKALIEEWNQNTKKMSTLVNFYSTYKGDACNTTKGTPCLQADILGDWREEVILYDYTSCDKLMIFSSPYVSTDVIPTFMHDHQYRMAVAWQNVAYNQPPHLSYYLPDFDYDTYIERLKSSTSALDRIDHRGSDLSGVRYIALPGKVQLLCSGLEGQALQLRIQDMSGRLLRHETVTVGDDASILLNTDALSHGVYLFSLTSAAGQWSKKVIW